MILFKKARAKDLRFVLLPKAAAIKPHAGIVFDFHPELVDYQKLHL